MTEVNISDVIFRVSLRSKSPEDSISLLSEETGSIDSMLNHSSKEEDEIKVLMECDQDILLDNHTSDIYGKLLFLYKLNSTFYLKQIQNFAFLKTILTNVKN